MDLIIDGNMSEKEEVLRLIKSLQKGLKQFTLKEFNEAISSVINPPIENEKNKEKHISLILDLICEEYALTRQELIYGRAKGDVQKARSIAYCILHFSLKLPIRYIANKVFFLKWHNSVGVAIQYYKNLNCEIQPDKEFKDKLEKIQASAINKLKKNKV
jgi:chromosomal replication initiation ATPase DnaA